MSKVLTKVAVFLFAAGLASSAHAQQWSAAGTITFYTTGFLADQVRVQTTAPFINPANCPTTDGYITNPSDSGNHTHQAALLGAYLSGKTVQIVVSTTACYLGRPQIIAVTIIN